MNRLSRREVLGKIAVVIAAGTSWDRWRSSVGAAIAENWPSHPIELVVGYAAGGGTDVVMRALARPMSAAVDTTIVVTNQPGAVAALATDTVWRRNPDGYSWLGTSSYNKFLRVQGLHQSVPWSDWQFFQVATSVQAWGVATRSPIRDFADLLQRARARPGQLRVSNSGNGGLWHEGTLLLGSAAGVEFQHIPYEGGAPAALAALRGEVDVAAAGLHEQIEFVRAGRMRCLAVFTPAPVEVAGTGVLRPVTEYVPGLSGYAPFGAQYTIGVRRQVPRPILLAIRQAIEAGLTDQSVQEQMERMLLFPAALFGEAADKMAARLESATAWLFWQARLPGAKVNPEELGLPKPEDFDRWWPPAGYTAAM